MPARHFNCICFLAWTAVLASAPAATALAAAADTAQVDLATEESAGGVPDGLTMRARIASIKPAEPVGIAWRHGGEGLGGEVVRGVLAPKLDVGEWSPPVPVKSFVARPQDWRGKLFLTFTTARTRQDGGRGRGQAQPEVQTDVEFEFEFSYAGKVVKTFKELGPDGGTAGIVIPAYRLTAGVTPADPKFLDDLTGILEYARRRTEMLEKFPWAAQPVPRKFMIITDVGGYGQGSGYGIRTTNKAVVEVECRALRQLGVNGLRSAPQFLTEMAAKGEGYAKGLGRGHDIGIAGYPVPAYREGRKDNDPQAGCPFGSGVAALQQAGVEQALAEMLAITVPEVYGLTVDEIGAVVDRSPEGKGHLAVCPRCAEAFREYLKGQGLSPGDFGAADWSAVKPVELPAKGGPGPDVSSKGPALAAYETRMFLNWACSRLFTPLRDACAKANEAKRQAVAAGRLDSPAAKQPYIYSYALRGNTFLMKGHSLDFFDFYRNADNAFVYETSNRDPRIWQWDSYLCDVGRVVSARQGLAFGIYVKPHRGAPIQRALAAAGRGATMIYWYTYGPDYKKGDSFSQSPEALALASRAARILGRSEDVIYGAAWTAQAQVAVVKPRATEIWMGLLGDPAAQAAWENAKWIYTALAHAHIPVDAIDEVMIARDDLARYKIIYVNGTHLTRAAAEKLARWVEAGGTLYTSGGGCARDEANQPLAALAAALGLESRTAPEMYYRITLYGASGLEPYGDARNVIAPVPEAAKVAAGAMGGALKPVVGREILKPKQGAEVVARFADGAPAAVRNACGKGQAYTVGFFPGLEYSAAVRTDSFDMSKDFDAGIRSYVAAPALALVKPVVDASQPAVEGLLVKNPETGRQAVILMNWTYRVSGSKTVGRGARPVISHVAFKDVKVTVRGAGAAKKAVSAALDKAFPVETAGDAITVTIPELAEGDVLLLE